MATSGHIGISRGNDKVEYIYVHFDAYPEYMWGMLKENYSNPEKAEKLISLGDCSSIDKEVDIPEGVEHSFDRPADGITIAYHRDRGEDWEDVHPQICDERDFTGYLFKDGEWLYIPKRY